MFLGLWLNIPEQYQIINVIALGKPIEKVVIEEMCDGDFKYWRDNQELHDNIEHPALSEAHLGRLAKNSGK